MVTSHPPWDPASTLAGKRMENERGSELVGRQPLRTHLRAAAEAAANSRGRLVLLTGEPGIGKTSLASDVARGCEEAGFLVMWGTGWDGEGTPAFWPWVEAIRRAVGRIPQPELAAIAEVCGAELGRLLPELAASGAGDAPRPEGGEGSQFRLFDAVWTMLRVLAESRPVTVVLDDLHWADVATLDLIRFVTARARSAPVLVVAAYRDVEIGAGHPLRASLTALRSMADLIPVAGLDVDAVGQLLATIAGRPVDRDLVETAHRRTGGNPFFVREVGRLMQAQGERIGVPEAVRDVVHRRLARLSQPCQDLLRLAAVLGQECDVPLLAEVTGEPEADIIDLVHEAERSRVLAPSARGLTGVRFVHDLFREALYGTGPAAYLEGIHRRVGEVLEQRRTRGSAVGVSELAHHFLRSGPGSRDRSRAIRYSIEAARDAFAQLAPHQALAHARRASAALDAQEQPDGELRLESLLILADAERRAGEGSQSRLTLERAAALARRLGRADGLARAALLAQLLGDDYGTGGERTAALLEESVAALGDAPGALRARVLAAWARHLYHHDRARATEAQALAVEAVHTAETSGDASALAYALFAQHDAVWQPGTARQRLAIARRMESVAAAVDAELRTEAVLLGAIASLELCDPGAVDELRRYARLATALRDPRFHYLALTRQITATTLQGDLEATERLIDEASLLGAAASEPDLWHVETRELWVLRTLQRRRHELEARVRSWPYPVFVTWYAAQVVLSLCDRGAVEEARAASARLTEFDPSGEALHNLWLVQAVTVAEAAAAIADRDLATRLYDALAPYAGLGVVTAGAVDFYGAVHHYLGLLAVTLGRNDEAAEHFRRAEADHRRLGATPWVTRSQRQLADLSTTATAPDKVVRGDATMGGPRVRRGYFQREGEWWRVALDAREVRLPDAKGLRDIHTLLGAAGRSIPAADLLSATGGQEAAQEARLGADEVLDEQARSAYRARLAELEADLAEAEANNDGERIARARFERQLLADELASALGLGGRARLLGSGGERARKAVTARIRNSLRRMERSHPELAAHLSAAITTGTSCCYVPVDVVSWAL